MAHIANRPRHASTLARVLGYGVIAVVGAAPVPIDGADVATPSCGMVVQDQLVLDRDLRCPGPALIVRNPRSVVQLNGHTIQATQPCRDAGATVGIVVDVRDGRGCRIAGNRIAGNRGAGIRLDVDSQGNEIERNLVVGQRGKDVTDAGSDNLFTLNGFEHGDGVDPPPLWPLLGMPASPAPGVAGCGTLHDRIEPRATLTITCPQ